jgi:hypothetical protein
MARKEDYLDENKARCVECYCRCKHGNINFEDCEEYQNVKHLLNLDGLCWVFEAIISDIVKARAGATTKEGAITNPQILRALAERSIEDIPREAYE